MEGTTVNVVPNAFKVARLEDIDKKVTNEPDKTIVPTTQSNAPIPLEVFLVP